MTTIRTDRKNGKGYFAQHVVEPLDLAARVAGSSPSQVAYEAVLDEAASLRLRKVLAYGEERYREVDFRRSALLLFADLHRKWQRVDRWAESFLSHEPEARMPGETIRDTLLDLLNYAAMGVQLLDARREAEALRRMDEHEHAESMM